MNATGIFHATATALSVTTTGDFFQLRMGTTTTARLLEVRVWQTSDTALAMNGLKFNRGAGGSGGTGLTEREFDILGASPVGTAFSLPTGAVGTLDLDQKMGWNILQEFVWIPTPEVQIPLLRSDHFGISLINADTLTIGCTVVWAEYGA